MTSSMILNELSVIATETHETAIAYFKVAEQYGYKFIMQVKEIRDKQYYKAIGYDSFDEYCQTSWGTTRHSMNQRIEIADSFGNERNFVDTYLQNGHSKSLLLARMEPEQRNEATQAIENGEVKTVNALKQWHKEKQRFEMELKIAKGELAKVSEKLEEEMNKPTQTITETVEVTPKHLQKKLEDLELNNFHLKSGYEKAKEKLKQYDLRTPEDYDEEQAEKLRKKLQHEADITTMNVRIAYKNFIEQGAASTYIQGAIAHASTAEKKHLNEMVEMAEKVISDTKLALKGRKLGVVNEQAIN